MSRAHAHGLHGRPYRMRTACSAWSRLRGLIGRPAGWLAPDELLVFPLCRSVHTHFMSLPIDVAFLDGQGRVLRSDERVPPGRVLGCRGACTVLERFSPGCALSGALLHAYPPWPKEGEVLAVGASSTAAPHPVIWEISGCSGNLPAFGYTCELVGSYEPSRPPEKRGRHVHHSS